MTMTQPAAMRTAALRMWEPQAPRSCHRLRPFARLLLAVAAVRDKDAATARQILSALAQQFPNNPLYAKELRNIR